MANKDITETGVRDVLETMGIPTSFAGLKQGIVGRGEMLATMGSGIGASAVGGLAGLGELARTGNLAAAVDMINQAQQALTYQPRTQEGAKTTERYGSALEALAAPSEFVGEKALEITGSPAAATGAEILLDPLSAVIPGISKVGKVARPFINEATRLTELGFPESVAKRIASGELTMDQASRLQRAAQQGFNQRAYMGIREGAEDIYELDPDVGMGARRGTGNWAAQSPVQAETYARESTMPLLLNTSNYARVDFGGKNWNDKPDDLELELPNGEIIDVSGMDTNEIARKARELGVSGVQFEQITDLGPISRKADKDALREYYEYGDTQFVVFDPATARSTTSAAFDPEYVGSNILGSADPRLLAAIAGGSLVGAGLMSNKEDGN